MAFCRDQLFWFQWSQMLPLVHAMGLLNDVRELVELFAKLKAIEIVAVPLTFAWHPERERRIRSTRVAENLRLTFRLPPYLAARLVLAAPEVWASRLQEVAVDSASIRASRAFVLALRPAVLQANVAMSWLGTAHQYPWVRAGESHHCVRPADEVRELLFDLGLEEPAAPVADGSPEPSDGLPEAETAQDPGSANESQQT